MLTRAKVGGYYNAQAGRELNLSSPQIIGRVGTSALRTALLKTIITGLNWMESKVVIPRPLGNMVKHCSCSRYVVGTDQEVRVIRMFHYSSRSMYGMQIRSLNDVHVGSRAYPSHGSHWH